MLIQREDRNPIPGHVLLVSYSNGMHMELSVYYFKREREKKKKEKRKNGERKEKKF